MLFGCPPDGIKGGRIDIRLIVPVDIKAVEVASYDYHGTCIQPKAIDISIDGKMMKHVELANKPEQPTRIPLEAHGQSVSVLITECYPPQTTPDGKPGSFSGGWSRVRVFATTDVADMLKPVDKYNVAVVPDNIAPTSGSAVTGEVKVVGQPRMTVGHPCTLWDNEDIAHYKEMLKTSKELQAQVAGLQKSCDIRITQPVGVPPPLKGPDGNWRHISDMEQLDGRTYNAIHNQLSLDIANLGTVYAFTGEAKYADFAKKILLAYADAYPNYAVGARPGFAHAPSKAFDQVLSDATWIIPAARGYDLIHDAPSITPDERKHIEDDFLKGCARIICNHAMLGCSTNWSAIGTCAVLTIGYATDDQNLINCATHGIPGTAEAKSGLGLSEWHFGPNAIDVDGLWSEGAMGYQFMAMDALVMDAEMLWHHGVDMYRYRDCALKHLFDSPIQLSYPDLTTPATHDTGHGSIVGGEAFLYEYAYRRYRDPSYLLILNQCGTHLDAHFQQYPVSVLYDRDPTEKVPPVEWKSVNFFGVGYGVQRMTNPDGTISALLEYGSHLSHGHPDKLTLDLYAFNAQLMIDPGCVWYEQPLYHRWYRTTLAHPTLTVDERDQIMCGANQVIYGPADTIAIQRAWTREAYPGVTMDRSVFLTPNYVGDIFGVFARLPRKLDLAWHIRGEFASDLKMTPMTFPEPVENGYNELTDVQHATTDKPFSATVTRDGNVARLHMAANEPTELIEGNGHYILETPPTILERRVKNTTLYGNALDYSGVKDGYVKGVTQEGGLEAGYGLMKVKTIKGTDLCFASYTPGSYKAGGLETDAMQAYVLMDGKNVQALYLGGGKTLKVPGAALERNESGLAYLEKAENGSYVLANPSPSAATITATLAALANTDAFNLAADGHRTGPAKVTTGAVITAELPASSKIEFAPKGGTSLFDFRQAMLRKRQTDQEAVLAKAHDDCAARTKVRESEAAAKPAPAGTVLVAGGAEFSGQGGGTVNVSENKRAAVGKAIVGWNDAGHWLEWTFDAPAEGYYNLTLCYCSDLDLIEREIKVNGQVQEPFAKMVFPSTGGWANGSDDWRLFTAPNGISDQPLLVKLQQGKNVVRLTNLNGRGINVNYVVVTSPDVKVTRDSLAAKLTKN